MTLICIFVKIILTENLMKNILISFLIVAFPALLSAQDCGFYNFNKGAVLGYQQFDAKGKLTGTSRLTFLDTYRDGDAYIYKVRNETTTENSKEQPKPIEYTMRCENGEFYIDMSSMMDPATAATFGADVKVTGSELSYPSNLSVGQTLPDASFSISSAASGVAVLSMTIDVTNRVVAARESVTVPAGTFDCFKITYNVDTKMIFKISATAALWITKSGAMVKTESYDKKGKLTSSMVLSELKQ